MALGWQLKFTLGKAGSSGLLGSSHFQAVYASGSARLQHLQVSQQSRVRADVAASSAVILLVPVVGT